VPLEQHRRLLAVDAGAHRVLAAGRRTAVGERAVPLEVGEPGSAVPPTSAAADSACEPRSESTNSPKPALSFSMPDTVENCASWATNSAPFCGSSGSWLRNCSSIRRRKSFCPTSAPPRRAGAGLVMPMEA